MDSETSSSRDPRLARHFRPTLARTSSESHLRVGAQQSSTSSPIERSISSSDQLIRGVSDLVQAAYLVANGQVERERLQKKKEATATLCTKAKGYTSFPSTVAFFQKSQADEDAELTRVDEVLKKHAANYKQLENALRLTLTASIFDTSKSDQITNLQRDVQATKSELGSARTEITKLRDHNMALEHEVQELQERMSRTERTFSDHTSTLKRHAKTNQDTGERVAVLNSEVDKSLKSLVHKDQVDKLECVISGMHSKLESVQIQNSRNIEEYQDLLDNMRQDSDVKFDRLLADQLTHYDSRLNVVENKLAQAQAPAKSTGFDFAVRSEQAELKTQLHNVIQQMDKLQSLQAMKDDLQMSEMEELKSQLEQTSKDFAALKNDYSQLSETLKTVLNRDSPSAHEQVAALETKIQTTQRNMESVHVGLHSLGTRYNHLSTGPLVKSMTQVMQEMYPSAAQMFDKVNVFTARFEHRLTQLDEKLGSLEQGLVAQSGNMVTVQNQVVPQIENLNNQVKVVSQSLMLIKNPSNGQISSTAISADQLTEVRNEVKELASTINNYIDSRKTDDEALLQNMAEERDALKAQIQVLTDELAGLSARVTQLSETTRADMKKVQSYVRDFQRQGYDIRQIEATLNKWEDMAERIEKREESRNPTVTTSKAFDNDNVPQPRLPVAPTLSRGSDNSGNSAQKKKRPRISAVSDCERGSQSRASSLASFSSQGVLESTPNPDGQNAPKKPKKKRKRLTEEPIVLD
ncbi:uncharacterized protein BO97DRAFT_443464 [Aspergillus homomorphus CBS 101889]|uniref:Paramyosin n=1 Tax=Aspergillus homomorphus (strain CBS 101889) TaxID=1450537 RepID=A0A395HXB4_ASPHC|nr:hypothetical protein BO97DRAFT_443464 [Aspergillus homomorphus CBS 101889]RAL12075.1 hypothetical protein BO97DRAFT_443464 [Aspergillus homomorphus CBS 101889]